MAAETWAALAPLIAGARKMRLSPDGGRNFPGGKHERRLSAELPAQPATVPVYDADAGTGRLLVADLDVSRARTAGAGDPVARVAEDAAALAGLVARCGGRSITDVSPSGGRHVYILWSRPIPWQELRDVARAVALRFPVMDASPMCHPGGQIRPPGAPHKLAGGHLTGWTRLTVPLSEALSVARRRCGPNVWAALCMELTAELAAVAPGITATSPGADDTTARDDQGAPWLPRRGGRRPIREDLDNVAKTGDWSGYRSPSEARLAVLNSAAAAGWRLSEVLTEMGGQWPGLTELLGRRTATQRRAVMGHDWKTAAAGIIALRSARNSNTSERDSTRPRDSPPASATPGDGGRVWNLPGLISAEPTSLTEYQQIRQWQNAVWLAEHDPARLARWGRRAISLRLVLRALGAASQMTGGVVTEFGTRALSLMTGLGWTTVADALVYLRSEHDPLIDLLQEGKEQRADTYALRVPDTYRELAVWRRWRAGRIEAIHPVFRVLGGVAALVYEALSTAPTRVTDVERIASLSATAIADALRELGAYGLAERSPDGWHRGPVTLDQAAQETGAWEIHEQLVETYRQHRADWWTLLGIMTATEQTSGIQDHHPAEDLDPEDDPVSDEFAVLAMLARALGELRILTRDGPPDALIPAARAPDVLVSTSRAPGRV